MPNDKIAALQQDLGPMPTSEAIGKLVVELVIGLPIIPTIGGLSAALITIMSQPGLPPPTSSMEKAIELLRVLLLEARQAELSNLVDKPTTIRLH